MIMGVNTILGIINILSKAKQGILFRLSDNKLEKLSRAIYMEQWRIRGGINRENYDPY